MGPLGARFQNLVTLSACILIGLLPFLVPFEPNRNVDMQGLILLIAGTLSWCALAYGYRTTFRNFSSATKLLIGLYATCCLASLALARFGPYAFVGSPYIRLGSPGLLACVGCGLILSRLKPADLISYLYAIISLLAAVSVPYSLFESGTLVRIGGLASQADVFGVLLGCGLLLGLVTLKKIPRWRNYLLINQVFLSVLLILTGTRAAIILMLVLVVAWQLQNNRSKFIKWLPIYVVTMIVFVVSLSNFAPNRLTDSSYAKESIGYRRDLQFTALRGSLDKPVFGYGAGNLADALSCDKLTQKSLRDSCDDGYFFNSSHDIFIDRALGIGWPGAIAYLSIILLAIYHGLHAKSEVRIFGYLTLLISLYYLTNITSVVLELLLWVVLIQCLKRPGIKTSRA